MDLVFLETICTHALYASFLPYFLSSFLPFFLSSFLPQVRRMAGDFMMDPVVIYVGNVDALQANKDVTQTIHVVQGLRQKEQLLDGIIRAEEPGSRIIIFCSTKRMCDQVERTLNQVR